MDDETRVERMTAHGRIDSLERRQDVLVAMLVAVSILAVATMILARRA